MKSSLEFCNRSQTDRPTPYMPFCETSLDAKELTMRLTTIADYLDNCYMKEATRVFTVYTIVCLANKFAMICRLHPNARTLVPVAQNNCVLPWTGSVNKQRSKENPSSTRNTNLDVAPHNAAGNRNHTERPHVRTITTWLLSRSEEAIVSYDG